MEAKFANLLFPVCSLMISIFIFILFFSKKKIKIEETEIYSKLVFLSFIESFLYTFICLISHFVLKDSTLWLFQILNKILYIIYILWFSTLFKYIISILVLKHKKIIKKTSLILNLLLILLISVLPVEIFYDPATGMSNSYGDSTNILFAGTSLYLIMMVIFVILNIKNKESRRKFTPFYILAILIGIGFVIREVNPFINITSNTLSFVCLVMLFTIENPDVKIVEELVKNKQLVESSFEDKSVYLFKFTNQLREPVKALNDLVNIYKSSNNEEEKEKLLMLIEDKTKDLNFMINNAMDISSVDVNNVKVYNTVYDPYKFFFDIKKKTELKIKNNQNIDLSFNINDRIPNNLYGDSVKLKQVMMSLIDNAIKYTNKGKISINIDGIHRYDICRLIITIKDTGRGMNLEKVNELLASNDNLTKEEINKLDNIDVDLKPSLKIIKILGGIVNIKSNVDNGTELKVVLDQRVEIDK